MARRLRAAACPAQMWALSGIGGADKGAHGISHSLKTRQQCRHDTLCSPIDANKLLFGEMFVLELETMQPTLEELTALVHIVDGGSATAAAARLRVAKSVISKRVASLEAKLAVSLLHRSGRRMIPNDAGLLAYERAKVVLPQVDALVEEVTVRAGALRGPIHVSAPLSFGIRYLSPIVCKFMLMHPDVEVRLDLDDRYVDIGGRGYDLAIRIGRLDDSALKARRIATSQRRIYGSPAYVQREGRPRTLDDLGRHACLAYANETYGHIWQFEQARSRAIRSLTLPPRFVSNSGEALRDAAVEGLGLAALPTFLAHDEVRAGRLVEVRLPGWLMAPDTIQAVFLQSVALPARVRKFIDHIIAALSPPLPWEEADR